MAVMVEIVKAWLNLSTASILVCAESNEKVDLLHMALMKDQINSVRLVASPDNDDSNILTPEFEYSVDQMKEANSYFNAFYIRYPIIKKLIMKAEVVCTTLDVLTSEYFNGISFPRVIIDDAASTVEPLLLAGMTKNCQHVVLFGDHKVMPPKTHSEFAVSKGLKISLFERMIKQGYPYCFLDYQYIINPSISFFPSYKFYQARLKSGIDQAQLPLVPGFNWPNKEVGIALINIENKEEHIKGSIQNTSEAELLLKIYMKFLSQGEVELSEIGILTPYMAQRDLMKKALRTSKTCYPTIFGTQAEGQEDLIEKSITVEVMDKEREFDKDLILISTVRSNNQGNLGVLRDPRMLNSMLMKGRRGIVIVGNLNTLARNEVWRDFIFWALSNSIIFNYN